MHLPAAIAAAVGLPHVAGGSWPSEPFERGLIGAVEGSVKLRIGRVALSPQLGVANMRGVLQFGRDSFALEEIDGSIAGGRVAGSMSFERGERRSQPRQPRPVRRRRISPTSCPATAR